MSPVTFRAIRQRRELTQAALASVLRSDPRSVRKWEAGDREISGPVSRLMELLDEGAL